MKLGWFSIAGGAPGAADAMICELADGLAAGGMRLAGAVQANLDRGADCACDMDLRLLGVDHAPIRISQSLGGGSSGCRLDPGALERAAALASGRVAEGGVDLVIVAKFGRQEAVGRGFRQLIAEALEADLPVLLHVPPEQLSEFQEFAGDFAERLAPGALVAWCGAVARRAA